MKVFVQVVEFAIWTSIILLVWKYLFMIITDVDLISLLSNLFVSLKYYLWTNITTFLSVFFFWSLLIMIWRWIISLLSTDAWSRPNE